MAGYVIASDDDRDRPFHIGVPGLVDRIHRMNNGRSVLTIQLDGDEMDAALWGLENYRKSSVESPSRATKTLNEWITALKNGEYGSDVVLSRLGDVG